MGFGDANLKPSDLPDHSNQQFPYHPCIVYLPTVGIMVNVGTYMDCLGLIRFKASLALRMSFIM